MNLMFRCRVGSVLHGTADEKSDADFKGVYLPTGRQVLLGEYEDIVSEYGERVNKKIKPGELDSVTYSIKKYVTMFNKDVTMVSTEMLFSDLVTVTSPVWESISLLLKEMIKDDGFIKYRVDCTTSFLKNCTKLSIDTKPLYNMVRISRQILDLVANRDLVFPRQDSHNLLKIKHGEIRDESIEEVFENVGKVSKMVEGFSDPDPEKTMEQLKDIVEWAHRSAVT